MGTVNNSINTTNPGSYVSLSIPFTNWSYFVNTYASGVLQVVNSDGINGSPFAGAAQRDFGDVTLVIPVSGTYRFSTSATLGLNQGIAQFTINGVVTNYDNYAASFNITSITWDQVLSAGIYTVNLNSNTKNSSSVGYYLIFAQQTLDVRQIA